MIRSLTQDPDKFSEEAWNLLLSGEDAAETWRHENFNIEHLVQVLFTDNFFKKYTDFLPIRKSILLENLEEILASVPPSKSQYIFVSEDLELMLDDAENLRKNWGSKLIDIPHILNAIGQDSRVGENLFKESGLPIEKLQQELKNLPTPSSFNQNNNSALSKEINPIIASEKNELISTKLNLKSEINENQSNQINDLIASEKKEVPSAIDLYGKNLTEAAKAEKLDPVIGRQEEIRKVIKVLSRRNKNNPILIGASGVGKTAIAELLAQRIVKGEVPDNLKGLQLISLDMGALIAGAKFRGQFEERFRSLLTEICNSKTGIILFIDEIHNVISNERSIADAGSLMKPYLASGELRCIGATTPENYRKTVEKDQALNRRFQQVFIKEPNLDLSIDILRGIKGKYESHHGIQISDEALITAIRLADRYVSDRCLPDKAIDLIDEAAAQLKIETTSKPQVIEELESKIAKLELSIRAAEKEHQSESKIIKLESEKENYINDLDKLIYSWKTKSKLSNELKNILNNEINLHKKIQILETNGNLEEAAKIKYRDLENLNQEKSYIKERLQALKVKSFSFIKDTVDSDDIADIVSRLTGIPVNKVLAGERQKLLELEKELSRKVIGQYKAVQAVSAAIRRARAGMKDPKRPVGSFMFLGPTGVGKTELAKALAASLFDEEDALIRLDMSEFSERNAVARLIGAPPGYVGYEEGGQLTESVRTRPYAVLLLDEVEKAHTEVFNILLQVLDDGRLTDSQGRTIDFKNTVIVMTSNIASHEILENSKNVFSNPSQESELINILKSQIDNALKKQFRPEFINRIDEVIQFNPLTSSDLIKIVKLLLQDLVDLLKEQNIILSIEEEAINFLASEGYQPEYGARPLKRVLRRNLENPLATELLAENFENAKEIKVLPPSEGNSSLRFNAEH